MRFLKSRLIRMAVSSLSFVLIECRRIRVSQNLSRFWHVIIQRKKCEFFTICHEIHFEVIWVWVTNRISVWCIRVWEPCTLSHAQNVNMSRTLVSLSIQYFLSSALGSFQKRAITQKTLCICISYTAYCTCIALDVAFPQSQNSIDNLLLYVSFATFCWKKTKQIQIGE